MAMLITIEKRDKTYLSKRTETTMKHQMQAYLGVNWDLLKEIHKLFFGNDLPEESFLKFEKLSKLRFSASDFARLVDDLDAKNLKEAVGKFYNVPFASVHITVKEV